MAGRAWAVALVAALLGGGLAGCVGKPDDDAEDLAPQDAANETFLDANESTQTPDGRGEISAFQETNRTETGTGGMTHAHDYWGGETRKELLSQVMWFVPLPLWPCRSGTAPSGDCYNPGTSIADIDIPAPRLVYEGTDHLEVTFKDFCVGPTGISVDGNAIPCVPNVQVRLGFDYLTSADEPGQWRQGGFVQEGQPVLIPVEPEEADMPHQAKSFWLFRIHTEHATSVIFNFTVTAVKGNAVANWPPHPDLYAEKTERTILDGPFVTETKGWAEYWLTGHDANWVHPDRVISYGTERVEVTVTKKSFTMNGAAPALEPDFFYLDHHNASFISKMGNGDLVGGRAYDEGSDGTTFRFVIPVTEYDMDTPYGQMSRWGFRFMARYSSESCPDVEQSIQQGCQWFPYRLEYDMKIVAYGHSTAGGFEEVNPAAQQPGETPNGTTEEGRTRMLPVGSACPPDMPVPAGYERFTRLCAVRV